MAESSDVVDQVLRDLPRFHLPTGESSGRQGPGKSLLPKLYAEGDQCYGIAPDLARYLANTVRSGWDTLETGAGLSTVILAAKGARHTAVTPQVEEHRRIRAYLDDIGVTNPVEFIAMSSELYLPSATGPLDLVLVDGKHAHPWPTLDWFFTGERLKVGGVVILDDDDLRPVAQLCEFLAMEPGWRRAVKLERSTVFEKARADAMDTSFDHQPWTVATFKRRTGPTLVDRAKQKAWRILKNG